MAHYVVTIDGVDYVIGDVWSEQDAIEQAFDRSGKEWSSVDDLVCDSWRPATVREALTDAYGDDWQVENYRNGLSHVANVAERREVTRTTDGTFPSFHTDYVPVLVIRGTENRDVHGYDDPVSISNYRALYDRWSELEGLSNGPYSNCDVIALDLDKPAPFDLIDVLESLAQYPVIDEEEWSMVEQELIQEHYDSYGRNDVLDSVAEAIGLDSRSDLTDAAESIVDRLVWEGILDYGCGGGYPTMIDSSACDFGAKSIAWYVANRLGTVVEVKSQNGYGDSVSLDLTPENLVRQ
ncbi:hypothetical protein [Mycobacterium paragordonae]|uniref:Uncharacterized protein n=1 Tax=Mycobacterium paragordonae TaxID=1389713 RepID=A0AAJ1W1F6_9MYCO|nr:hypothetical protein [Mycobacterium paragordonae]MDP7733656.1 hypothetical protein [Mycobacterium paragordonae]